MRLFTGLSIESPVREALVNLMNELSPTASIKWSPAENLHITAKFIGQWPEHRLAELTDALRAIPRPGSFRLEVDRLGFLPNPHRPRTFLAAVRASPELTALAGSIEEALVTIGCPREQRKYTPHITLARISNEDVRSLREHIAAMNNLSFGTFEATRFSLYESKQGPRNSVYTILENFPLETEAFA